MSNIEFDVDLDFGNRDDALKLIEYIPASIIKDNLTTKHNTGIYVTEIPINILTNTAVMDYKEAEKLGYFKLDFLNVNVYDQIGTPEYLEKLLNDSIPWHKFNDRKFVEQLIHLGNHYDLIYKMPEPINSIPRLAMMLSVIRPGKRHLVGKKWIDVAKTVWEKDAEGKYSFKRSHAVSYAILVTLHARLLVDKEISNG